MQCEKCQKEHNGTFGSGRFCSRSCANSKTFNEKTRKLKSIKGLLYYSNHISPNKGKPGRKHTEEEKQKISKIKKEQAKHINPFKVHGNSYFRKTEKHYLDKIEIYLDTKNLKPNKIGKHWFDFVNDKYIIELTLDRTAGISDAIKRFSTIINDKRQKYLICKNNWFGKLRRTKLYQYNVNFIDIDTLSNGRRK